MTTTTTVPPRMRIVRHPLKYRLLDVKRVQRITPGTVRVTFAGDALDGFCEQAPTDHVKLCFAAPGHDLPTEPVVENDTWMDAPVEPITRDYTIRQYRREARELDIDMVLHGTGVGSGWAAAARPGMKLGVFGPRGSEEIDFVHDWYLLGADETALPALARWLEMLPAGVKVLAFAEVPGPEDEQHLPTAADATVVWLHRGAAAPGTTDHLERAVRAAELPPGMGFAWIAGEAHTLRPIRRHLRNERGLGRDQVDVDGYWKRGTANHDHHEDEHTPHA
ncbi:NADPH-dependent ferric siderophore reductase [Kitasatospora sp. SolWspMP-SS2h]|uniref:siderophore-interacting protein n=1 Tax=Kitasatospora sp. SolWspMP-SS2h TaxID=1305729 RepID=UPI000DB925CB|nr:siderophore-interacting protein [Kitasatospora sp. SolWspMP-SS2h]RAJ45592.1 NADPH-dependent ferric siderophore reductase [Kitasatospora sp. SolWspMP-SS2h]